MKLKHEPEYIVKTNTFEPLTTLQRLENIACVFEKSWIGEATSAEHYHLGLEELYKLIEDLK